MKRIILILAYLCALSFCSYAQKKAIEEEPAIIDYEGEYEWYVAEKHLKWADKIYDLANGSGLRIGEWASNGNDLILSYEIECVGFPFFPELPTGNWPLQQNTLDRVFLVPEPNTLNGDYYEDVFDYLGYFPNSNLGELDLLRFRKQLLEEMNSNGKLVGSDHFETSSFKVNWDPAQSGLSGTSLVSSLFHGDQPRTSSNRVYFPHSALKHTIKFTVEVL